MKYFQVLSRNNDINGNPYRLVICYNEKGAVEAVYEARDSRPNIVGELRKTHLQLLEFHLSPKEYNGWKINFREWNIPVQSEN